MGRLTKVALFFVEIYKKVEKMKNMQELIKKTAKRST